MRGHIYSTLLEDAPCFAYQFANSTSYTLQRCRTIKTRLDLKRRLVLELHY